MLAGYYQFKPQFGDVENNLKKMSEAISSSEGDLIVCPELCTTGYQFTSTDELKELAEAIPGGKSVKQMESVAKSADKFIVFGLAENDNGKFYNSAVLVGPDGYIGKYRKIHLFFEENLWFTSGNDLPEVYDINGLKIGMVVCFDWFFPELFRILALEGAHLVAQPACLVLPYCQQAMKIRSIENRIFTITSNRFGSEAQNGKPELVFTGQSQVTDPFGNVLCSADDSNEKIEFCEIDTELADNKILNTHNTILESRRPEIYSKCKKY